MCWLLLLWRAAKKLNVQLPIILRLEGTNVEEGREIIASRE